MLCESSQEELWERDFKRTTKPIFFLTSFFPSFHSTKAIKLPLCSHKGLPRGSFPSCDPCLSSHPARNFGLLWTLYGRRATLSEYRGHIYSFLYLFPLFISMLLLLLPFLGGGWAERRRSASERHFSRTERKPVFFVYTGRLFGEVDVQPMKPRRVAWKSRLAWWWRPGRVYRSVSQPLSL